MITKPHLARLGLPLLAASTFVLPVAVPSAAALVAIGDHANLLFNGSVTVRANDNIFLEENDEESDVIFVVAPGLELNIGSRANANVNLYYREDIYYYADNSHLDDNYSNVFLSAYLDQARLDLELSANYQELAQPTPNDIIIPGQLIERDTYGADVRGEYDISEKTSIAVGLNASSVDYEDDILSDRDTVGVPVDLYYELTPSLDLSLGYRYRQTDTGKRAIIGGGVDRGTDYDDHFFNVGVRGEVAPKLLGEARIGYQEREIDGGIHDGKSESGLSFGMDFSHFTTPKTTLTAGVFRDFETGGRASSITAQGIDLGVRYAFSHLITGDAGIRYSEREWDRSTVAGLEGREDERFEANLGVTYSPNRYLDLMASYVFRTNDSTDAALDYDNNILSLSAALRY